MNFSKENPILIGKIKLSYEEFYDGYINKENQNKYNVSKVFYGVIKKYPPTCKKIETIFSGGEVSYNLLDVDVAVIKQDLEKYSHIQKVWNRVSDVQELSTLVALQNSNIYKVLFVQENGTFSNRTLLDSSLEAKVKDITNEIYVGKQFYRFFTYTYATYIETKADVKTYTDFQEYYGKYIYAITLEHGNNFLGLTWLDFIMHEPDGHLELGANSSLGGKRFEAFNTFRKGDELKITIMAEGFKDVILKVDFKKNPSIAWTDMWYKKAVKKRMEKENER